ncbi:MAG: ferrochelatase [Porticoccaceae bacterium]|nr:ferrochelatase [Porticoccaceae bacterium]RPG82264.1 MAG: ferrochelatase [Cellvibrionales bacterium TMED47]CAI8299415.1 MAG: Ferrochelatase [Cellvibrionales bacterium UBA7375]|tara:strand:+ start:1461 stop:2483 length:1023 start_codon:yes stop_codon:yes gene_type:complete
MKYIGQTDYDHEGASPRQGILLCNLGTPDAPRPAELRRYLKEFLSDPRVVEIPRLLWWMILNLIILRIRPRRSAKLYQSVWTEAGSPLMLYSQGQVAAVKQRLAEKYGDIPVVLGMRYGNPSMASAIKQLTDQNVRDIIVLPLYPQYAGATTGSTFDAIAKTFTKLRWVPELQFINGYHKSEGYLDALCTTIKRHIEQHGQPDKFVFSYHGTPERYLKNGDPYHCFCHQTTRLVREKLGFDESQVMTTFQSRFGREPWLQPYTDKTLEQLPEDGVKHVVVICPGFSSDCLETIEEINMEARESFIESGGEHFHYIPCLNDDPVHIDALVSILEKRLSLSH